MNTVTIKEFQRNIYACIKELPCLITKDGKPFLKVESFSEDIPQVATIRPVEVATRDEYTRGEQREDRFSDKPLPGYKFSAIIGKYIKV
jgi:hypothetical protein